MIQEPLIDQNFEELFEDELISLDESTRDALINYTPPKKIVDLSVEVIEERSPTKKQRSTSWFLWYILNVHLEGGE